MPPSDKELPAAQAANNFMHLLNQGIKTGRVTPDKFLAGLDH